MTTPRQPWHPADWEPADATALQALARGEADSGQQRRALKWLIEKAAMTYDETFVPGSPDVSDFLAGRRSVGTQIVKLLHVNVTAIVQAKQSKTLSTNRRA